MRRYAQVDADRPFQAPWRQDAAAPRPAQNGRAPGTARHDFANVALTAPAHAGELSPPDRQGGNGDEGPPAPAPAKPADTKAPAPKQPAEKPAEKPVLTQSAVGITVKQKAKALSQRGAAEYKVQWSVGGKKNGWVIQHLTFAPSIQDKDGKAVVAKNLPLEYWEGWQVRDGSVYIGDSDQAHQSDTFRTISESADTKGTILEAGKVSFVEGYKLTKPPWGSTVPEAGSLPNMKAAPPGWSDGAAQDHTMTVTYDDIAGTPQQQVGNP